MCLLFPETKCIVIILLQVCCIYLNIVLKNEQNKKKRNSFKLKLSYE